MNFTCFYVFLANAIFELISTFTTALDSIFGDLGYTPDIVYPGVSSSLDVNGALLIISLTDMLLSSACRTRSVTWADVNAG
jgi:hypothetical protein